MATITNRDGREKPWQVMYRTPDGASRRKQFARKVDAEQFLIEVEHEKRSGLYVDPRAGKVTLREYAQQR